MLIILVSQHSRADLAFLSEEERTAQAVAVISGEVVSIDAIKFPTEKFSRKIAIVKVNSVEKGDIRSGFILVSIGMVLPDMLKSSQTIDVKLAVSGRWFLDKDETGLFVLNRPDNFLVD